MRSPNHPYSERLDHLRFFAALLVLSFHSFHPIYIALTKAPSAAAAHANPLSVFIMEGHTAIGLFLTLSGFLFARICLRSSVDFKQFYSNRLLRIYPLYISVLLLSMCVVPSTVGALLTSLLTLQTMPTAIHGNYTDHLWSIGVEVQFYVLFPVLLLAYRKSGLTYLLQVIVLCLLVLLCVQLATGSTRDAAYATILGRLPQAVIGMILGFSFDRVRRYTSSPLALVAALAVMSSALLWFHACGGLPGSGQNPIWVFWLTLEGLCWGAVICCYEACSVKLPATISKAVAQLGAMSYSIYVMHYFLTCALVAWFVKLLVTPHHRHAFLLPLQDLLVKHPLETSLLAGTFVILPPTLLLSYFTFNVIERPFMGLRRKYVLPDDSSPPSAEVLHEERELAYRR
jgi:peptidoglycan/LPS O-acetylase OafA/YrhL